MERSAIEQVVRQVIARLEAEAKTQPDTDRSTAPAAVPAVAPAGAAVSAESCVGMIPVEMSARHVHLCAEDLRKLFGTDALPSKNPISQPGQYLSEYRVRLIGPGGVLEHVAVLGPVRNATQTEISATDARTLGIKPPVRISGDLSGAATVILQNGEQTVQKPCAIIALRHVHMTPEDAAVFSLHDGQTVSLAVDGTRPLVFGGVKVRVSRESALALHIDTDEANAAGAGGKTFCRIVPDIQAVTAPIQKQTPAVFSGTASAAPTGLHTAAGAATLETKLLCERDVLTLKGSGATMLRIRKDQIVTPLAQDALRALGIALVREGCE